MISKADFHRYVRLQRSGRENMADRFRVAVICGLREEEVKEIQDRYEELKDKYGDLHASS